MSHAVRNLYAQHNRITTLGESLRPLSQLRALVVSDNQIRTLAGSLRWCNQLQLLDASRNKIADLDPRYDLPRSLRHVVLAGNPWAILEPRYRALLQEELPHLVSLDGFDILTGEEVMPSAAAGEAAAKLLLDTSAEASADASADASASAGASEGDSESRPDGTAGLADDAEAFFRRMRHRSDMANPTDTSSGAGAGSATEGSTFAVTEASSVDAGAIRAEMMALRERRVVRLQAEVDIVRARAAELSLARSGSRGEEAASTAVGAVHSRAELAMERSRERIRGAREEHARRMVLLRRDRGGVAEGGGGGGGGGVGGDEQEEGKDGDDGEDLSVV
jgi:hypothetical protein